MSIKVCHFTSVHPRFDSRIFYKQCKTLAGFGFDVNLVVADGKRDEIVDGVKIYNVNNGKVGRLARMTRIVFKVYRKVLEINADIYHFHDPELLLVAYFLKRRDKIVVYDVHEDVPQDILIKTWLPLGTKKVISLLFSSFEKFIVEKLDHVITTTEFIYSRFVKYQSNTTCIKNYTLPDDILENVDWNSKTIDMCYIGGISKVRGVFEMIDLVQGSNLKLELAGLFENEKLFEEIKSLDGWKNVNYNGYVSRDCARNILRTSKIGLLLLHPTVTHLYSLPVKLFEYMAAGLPVISSNLLICREIIEENECGYCVDLFNKEMLYEKIELVLRNPQLAEKLGSNGCKAVREKFNWDVEGKKLIDVYNNLSKQLELLKC